MKNSDLVTKNDLDELKRNIVDAIEHKLQDISKDSGFEKRWLRTQELADYLSISTTQVHCLKAQGVFSCKKVGGTNFYDKEEVDAYIKSQGRD